jgi:hypothetical protein
MSNFNFWQKWLFFVGIYLLVFGLVLAFFNQTAFLDIIFNNNINPVFWNNSVAPAKSVQFQSWIYGVLGATVSGWGVFIAFLAHYPFKAREKWAWHCLALSTAIWFMTDTSISLFYHVTFNAAFNVILVLLLGLPLVFTRRQFNA